MSVLGVALAAIALAGCGRVGFGSVDASPPLDGGALHEGDLLFVEHFDDPDFGARDWFDGAAGVIDTAEHAPGSVASFACAYATGGIECPMGSPRRHRMPAVDAIYFSYWIKAGAPGVQVSIAHWIADPDAFVGPFSSQLTVVYGLSSAGGGALAVTDATNVDRNCVELTDGSIIGCGGNFATYPFTEARAVAGCNGTGAGFDLVTCTTAAQGFVNEELVATSATPFDGAWHFVEGYVKMSSIAGGVGVADGVAQYWVDGTLVFTSDRMLYRTGARSTLAWNELYLAPYIPAGASMAFTIWIDELTVARGR